MEMQAELDHAFGVESKMTIDDLERNLNAAQQRIWHLQREGEFKCMEWQGVVAIFHEAMAKFIRDNK